MVEAGGDGRDDNINKTASWLDSKGGMTDARGPYQGASTSLRAPALAGMSRFPYGEAVRGP